MLGPVAKANRSWRRRPRTLELGQRVLISNDPVSEKISLLYLDRLRMLGRNQHLQYLGRITGASCDGYQWFCL
jgi:hypothetical protein